VIDSSRILREPRLWSWKIQQHDIRALLLSFCDNLTAIRRDVKVANIEIGREVGQPSLSTSLQIDEPEILC
jgi:hypothetical protein